MSKSLHELKLGTYKPNVQTITNNTTIIEALKLFLKYQVSCLPIVNDEDGQLIEIYAKFDVINLAITRSYNNLNVRVYDALEYRRFNRDRYLAPLTCLKTDSLQDVMVKIVESGVHRLIIIDENNKVEGIISLSDILKFLTNWSTDDDDDDDDADDDDHYHHHHHHYNNHASKQRNDLVRMKKFITNPLRNSYQ
ncbi:AMP-activated protein kinase, gamma regulatory subunit, putative [Schistosoma mansoni]|uniref:AMP-activated protein kinase, gamma regulatory subunit, putative n=1 Tax=Schistosoma mansoni TaxID=6183 RepID=UPI00022C8435|nr:AMP-activated protein kinase, gamma regulatory subunit, putative [Schistosoma mansoni]|eukprot:XP_018647266.1 AMP-activated protein kinase, gamma regulatory subunit, putative [Schistosoma mansoni]